MGFLLRAVPLIIGQTAVVDRSHRSLAGIAVALGVLAATGCSPQPVTLEIVAGRRPPGQPALRQYALVRDASGQIVADVEITREPLHLSLARGTYEIQGYARAAGVPGIPVDPGIRPIGAARTGVHVEGMPGPETTRCSVTLALDRPETHLRVTTTESDCRVLPADP
jgi:hypothetical protein